MRATSGSITYTSKNYVKHTYPNAFYQYMLTKFKEDLSGLLDRARPRTVLEVGCGEGFLLEYVVLRRPHVRFSGVDISGDALDYARRNGCAAVSLARADANRLPFKSRSFDCVLCSEVLEHLPDVGRAVAELRRVARRHVLISVPLEPYFQMATSVAVRLRLGEDPDHVQFWSQKRFKSLVQANFRSVVFKQSALYQIALCEV